VTVARSAAFGWERETGARFPLQCCVMNARMVVRKEEPFGSVVELSKCVVQSNFLVLTGAKRPYDLNLIGIANLQVAGAPLRIDPATNLHELAAVDEINVGQIVAHAGK
jgi:hypothetical protein